ncbi:MAG: transporter substrate-binding domain-containing protein [Desulfobacterales bacterium]|nr:transporter substrate-binding domain-containing protein [Desulfobacterales bacterium]
MRKTKWRGMQDGPKFGMRRVITAAVWGLLLAAAVLLISAYGDDAEAGDLDAVIQAGKLRHIGVHYANFVISANAGLDVELVRAFAEHLGVQYEFVASSWSQIIADLSGQSGP